MRKVFTVARVAASVPLVLAGVVCDELRWQKVRRQPDYEPGMREWYSTVCEDIRRVLP